MSYSLFGNRQMMNTEIRKKRVFERPKIIKYFSNQRYKTNTSQEIKVNNKQEIKNFQFIIREKI